MDCAGAPPSAWREIGVEEGCIFNIFDFQTFKVTIDFTPRQWIDGDDTCIEKMEKLALLQCDEGGEAKQGAIDERRVLKMAGDVERMTQVVEDECPVALKMGSIRYEVGEGIVWVEDSLVPLEDPLRFKLKGLKRMIVVKRMLQK